MSWRDRRLRFHRYDRVRPSPGIGGLLREIGRGLIATFWGMARPGCLDAPMLSFSSTG